jgi:hypothetical protein
VSARPLPVPINPALLRHADEGRQSLENRVADTITRFAGSIAVRLHLGVLMEAIPITAFVQVRALPRQNVDYWHPIARDARPPAHGC